jgi:hypothetical protein
MTVVLPIGYVTILEAAEMLQPALHAGVADSPIVTKLRREGIEVNDGPARDRAIAELWKAVDKRDLRAVAIGGRPRRIVNLPARFTEGVPKLRSPRGRGFTFLRPSKPESDQLVAWFGPSFHTATLAFREIEVRKLAHKLMRVRRSSQRTSEEEKRRGRSRIITAVQPVIMEVIGRRKWNPTMTIKALTREVNRAGKWQRLVSQDTVTRAIDAVYEQTGDRQFERVRHKRRPRSSGS